jgi:hypothetical protein
MARLLMSGLRVELQPDDIASPEYSPKPLPRFRADGSGDLDGIVLVFVRDAGNQDSDIVACGSQRLDNDPTSFLPNIDRLIQAHLRRFQHRGWDAYGRTIAPLLHHALHR